MSKSGIEFGGGVGGNSYVVCLAILIAGRAVGGALLRFGLRARARGWG